MSRRPARCTQADIARALRAVEQAGARSVVEIAPDGTIRIVPDLVGQELASAAVEKNRRIVL